MGISAAGMYAQLTTGKPMISYLVALLGPLPQGEGEKRHALFGDRISKSRARRKARHRDVRLHRYREEPPGTPQEGAPEMGPEPWHAGRSRSGRPLPEGPALHRHVPEADRDRESARAH